MMRNGKSQIEAAYSFKVVGVGLFLNDGSGEFLLGRG
jgi:hypothetical protein